MAKHIINHSSLQFNTANFDFSEFTEFTKEFGVKTKNFKSWIRRWCLNKAKVVLDEAKGRTPIDTGNLLASWNDPIISINGNQLEIVFSNNAEYAGWVEYGHATPFHAGESPGGEHWVEGRFMLTVPLQDFVNDFAKDFEDGVFDYLIRNYS